jgi:hypothetical protein
LRKLALLVSVLSFIVFNGSALSCWAQAGPTTALADNTNPSTGSNGSAAANATVATQPAPTTAQSGSMPSRIAVGVKVSLLGAGVEMATPITYRTNLRFGFNAFSYSRGFTNDGVGYDANLSFRSVETHFDWFPFAGAFHLSPGAMLYNGNKISANASVTSGQSFSLGGTSYISDPANPITGTGKIGFNKVAPEATFGWGNLLPRSSKHFSIPFEAGVVFEGSPKAALNLTGSACAADGTNCHDITNDTTFQSNVVAQQNKLNNNMSFFKFYPIISLGVGYKF